MHSLSQRFSFQKLGHRKHEASVCAKIVNRQNVRMRDEPPTALGLPLEAGAICAVVGESVRQDFDGHVATQSARRARGRPLPSLPHQADRSPRIDRDVCRRRLPSMDRVVLASEEHCNLG